MFKNMFDLIIVLRIEVSGPEDSIIGCLHLLVTF